MHIPGLDKLIGKIEYVLSNEAELVWHVPKELKGLKKELESIQVFLIDADQGEIHGQFAEEVEKKWVADIRDKSYEAEDIIDEFTYHHMIKHERHDDISCLSWYIHLLVEAPTTLWVMRETSRKLHKVKKSLIYIAETHARYKSGDAHDAAMMTRAKHIEQQQTVRNLRDGAYFVEEKTFIGFHREIESLQQWLTNEESSLAIISVYGMRGAGKTTLAAKIYNSQSVEFELLAWVTVSHIYSIIDVLRSLKKEVSDIKVGEDESYIKLAEKLQSDLKAYFLKDVMS